MGPVERRLREKELEYREQEVSYTKRGFWLNATALCLGLLTALAAVYAALQASRAVNAAQESAERGAREQRLANSIQALDGGTSAQRIAGVSLMTHSVMEEFERVLEKQPGITSDKLTNEQQDAVGAYLSIIDALENYVGGWQTSHEAAAPKPAKTSPVDRSANNVAHISTDVSAGIAPQDIADYAVPRDVSYAASDLNQLLRGDARRHAEALHVRPGVDLAGASLWGVSLVRFDTSWLSARYFERIDLRGANLTDSKWNGSDLRGSHLQCANLSGANFSYPQSGGDGWGADLEGADLRGANLSEVDFGGSDLRQAHLDGANLQGANLRGARVKGAVFTGADLRDVPLDHTKGVDGATGLDSQPNPAELNLGHCFDKYWEAP